MHSAIKSSAVSTPDALWVTEAGEVLVRDDPDSAASATPFLRTIGILIETLLPPFSEERQHVPAASLHRFPARLGGTAEPLIVSTAELLFAIQHDETDAPARILQHLVTRATGAPLDQPAHRPATFEELDREGTTCHITPFEGSDDSLTNTRLNRLRHRGPLMHPGLMTGRTAMSRTQQRPPSRQTWRYDRLRGWCAVLG